MPKQEENDPIKDFIAQNLQENIERGKQEFAKLLNSESLTGNLELEDQHELRQQQLQVDETVMQPLLIRLDEIIMLLKEVLEKV